MALGIDRFEKFSRTSMWTEAPLGDSSAWAAVGSATTQGQATSWARWVLGPAVGEARSGGVRPVGLPLRVREVVGEPACGGVPVDDLVEGQLAGQRARPADVAAELVTERLDQALHQQALPGRQGALLPAGGAPCLDQDEFEVPVRPATRLDPL